MPGRNEEAAVDATMRALMASTRIPDEIIVADGRSTDATRGRLSAWQRPDVPLTVIDNPGLFCGAGRQAAFEASRAEILIAFDFGNLPDPGYLEAMARPLEEDPSIDFVAGIFRPLVESPFEEAVAAIAFHERFLFDRLDLGDLLAKRPPPSRNFPGTAVAWRRSAWQQSGGMPVWLPTYEDVTFSRKLVADGARLGEQTQAFLWHHMRGDLPSFRRMCFNYARGRALTGSVDPRVPRALAAWTLIFILAVTGMLWWPSGLAALLLVGLYCYRSGLRQLIVADRGIRSAARLVTGARIVLARDFGTVAGCIAGLWKWATESRWRRCLAAYFGTGPGSPSRRLRFSQ